MDRIEKTSPFPYAACGTVWALHGTGHCDSPGLFRREVSKRLKETIYRVSRTKYSIGPYEEPKTDDNTAAVSLDETLHTMQALGVDLKIVDK